MILFKPVTSTGYNLFHEGAIALSQIEANGIRIDMDYIDRAMVECQTKVKELKTSLVNDQVYKTWRKHFGPETNLGSRSQLATILFDVMKVPCFSRTNTGRASTDVDVLQGLGIPFVQNYLDIERWKKAGNTYLKGIRREVCNEYLHPFFNLHTTGTYRSSSDSPNFQNIPVRRPEIAKLIRTAFIPRNPNRRLVEFDFKGIEVSTSACYNHDPNLIRYVSDPKTDMHRDMASQCYLLKRKLITKMIRYAAKSCFTFPEFYGNWYKAVAKDLWKAIDELNLETGDGISLKKHLRRQGIKGLGDCDPEMDPLPETFEHHIKEVEKDFWNRRFRVYQQWKEDWNDAYVEKGYFDTLTGFRCSAIMDRKQCVNYPIQGSAFHCLLWCLIRIQKLLRKYRMKSLIVGQIHDSLLMDVIKQEVEDVFDIVRQVTMVDLSKHWKWICVPMVIEAEMSPPGKSWYEKKEVPMLWGA